MKKSRARRHYDYLLDCYGSMEERQEENKRPMGFARPKSVEARHVGPYGIETQEWEAWHEEYA